MTQDIPTHQKEPGAPRAQLGFGRSPTPDPVDAAIERHRAAWSALERATKAVDATMNASKQAEDEANAAFSAASEVDGAAWADLVATRPATMPGAVRLLRYVSTSPDVDSVEDTRDLLQQLAAAVEAAEAGDGPAGEDLAATGPGAAVDPDPAFAVVAEFRASWDALGKAIDEAGGVGVPEVDPGIEDREGDAYERLKTVRPTTAEGFRALAGAWALVLGGKRMGEPGLQHADHAADSLIAGAGVCVPFVTDAPVSPALADLIARHRNLVHQADAERLDDAAAEALDAKAWTLFRQACAFPAAGAADFAVKLELAAPEIADGLEQGRTSTAVHAWHSLCADLRRFGLPAGSDPIDWTKPPPGFMASPAIKPFGFVNIPEGIKLEGRRLLEIAVAEYRRLRQPRGQWQIDMRATEEGRQLARTLQIETLAALAHPTLIEASAGYRYTGGVSTSLRDEDGRPLFELAVRAEAASGVPDPMLAAIAASRRAELEMEMFQTGLEGWKPEGWQDREQALSEAQRATRETVWRTVPTTRAGRRALVDYARFQVEVHTSETGIIDEAPALFAEILGPIAAAVEGERSDVAGSDHDLTALSVAQLARLYGALEPFEDLVGRAENAPCFWNEDRTVRTPDGDIICQEADRLGRIVRAIAEEIERRQPADRDERIDRLNVLVRRAALLDGLTSDRALLIEALAACGG